MALRVYNSLSRRIEPFSPYSGREVKVFVCGPTVYDYHHLGHARTYLAFDMIVRYLKFLGYHVRYLMNITDVAERVVQRAQKLQRDPLELARQYEAAFEEDMQSLGISVDKYERASDYIPQMIDQVNRLISKGMAYQTETGVYFEVKKFPNFGKLSGQTPEQLGLKRLELCSSKRNPEDFSLWRRFEGGLGWESPWGFGRPGWHIEDTAISMAHFGETYDLHGGASELIFPHHEAEIAQAEALTGKAPFVRYWLHTGLLSVEGRKMSKSLGNVVRIRDAVKQYGRQQLRYYFASFHYREPMVFSVSGLHRSESEFHVMTKDWEAFTASRVKANSKDDKKLDALLASSLSTFTSSMDNDFDTPRALEVLKDLARKLARLKPSEEGRRRAEVSFRRMADVLGVMP